MTRHAHPAASPSSLAPGETRTTCCYCGVGCGVIVQTDGRAVTGLRGDPDHPANFGRLCSKGGTLHLTAAPALQEQVRVRHPELRFRLQAKGPRRSTDPRRAGTTTKVGVRPAC